LLQGIFEEVEQLQVELLHPSQRPGFASLLPTPQLVKGTLWSCSVPLSRWGLIRCSTHKLNGAHGKLLHVTSNEASLGLTRPRSLSRLSEKMTKGKRQGREGTRRSRSLKKKRRKENIKSASNIVTVRPPTL
jgi:hypothetical protein